MRAEPGGAPLSEEYYKVLSFIMLNVDEGGVFKGSVEDIAKALNMDVSRVKHIIETGLTELGLVRVVEEPTLSDRLRNMEKLVEELRHGTSTEPVALRMRDAKNLYQTVFRLLKEVLQKFKEKKLKLELMERLAMLDRRMANYRLLSLLIMSDAERRAREAETPEEKLIALHELTLALYPYITILPREVRGLDRLSGRYYAPSVRVVDSKTRLLRENLAGLSGLAEGLGKLELPKTKKSRLIQILLQLQSSVRKEIEIFEKARDVLREIESEEELSLG